MKLILESHPAIKCWDEQSAYEALIKKTSSHPPDDIDSGTTLVGYKIPRFTEQLLWPVYTDPLYGNFPAFYNFEPVIFIIRDVLDTVASMLQLKFENQKGASSWLDSFGKEIIEHVVQSPFFAKHLLNEYNKLSLLSKDDHLFGAFYWALKNRGLQDLVRFGAPVHALSYESLCAYPRFELEKVCEFLKIEWHDNLLNHGSKSHGDLDSNGFAIGNTDPQRNIDTESIGKHSLVFDSQKMKEVTEYISTFKIDISELSGKNQKEKSIIFDQFSRYNACCVLLHHAGLTSSQTVLDVGSGVECLFGRFLPDVDISYIDPLIVSDISAPHRISGNIFSEALSGRRFNAITAVDVLEHIPPQYRPNFLSRVSSLAENTLVLAFPYSDRPDPAETDRDLVESYMAVYGVKYPWLKEHEEFGLPSVTETIKYLNNVGWHCQVIGHGHVPWLKELLSFSICVRDIPEMAQVILDASAKFNKLLASYDFTPPHYRTFVLATRSPIPTFKPETAKGMKFQELDSKFTAIMKEAHADFFKDALQRLKANEALIANQNKSMLEVSTWAKDLEEQLRLSNSMIDALKLKYNDKLERRESKISNLIQTITEKEQVIAEKEQVMVDKHSELMKMSDWAYGMMQELSHKNSPFHIKLGRKAIQIKTAVRGALARSVFGDLVRSVRGRGQYKTCLRSHAPLKQSLADCGGRLIIIFPIITWDFRWQRPQQIISRLRNRGYCILYLAMTITPLHRCFHSLTEAGSLLGFNELSQHIHQIWLHSVGHVSVYNDPLKGDDLFNISLGLESLLKELKPSSIDYLIQFPGWWPVAEKLKQLFGGKVIFDCMDDHAGFNTNTTLALDTEQELIEQADLVITSSCMLEDRCRSVNCNIIQVKNGTEFEHFATPQKNGLLDHLADRPIIGYYGAISDWFDMEIVAHCARQRPQWHFVLIGSTFGADCCAVSALTNVHFFGEKSYQELPGYLAYFDVCMIPFKIIPLTLATNPVKFYEYLSAGKPVVSVKLPELSPYAEDCYIAGDANEFLNQLEKALIECDDPEKVVSRLELARNNSWEQRVDDIMEALTALRDGINT